MLCTSTIVAVSGSLPALRKVVPSTRPMIVVTKNLHEAQDRLTVICSARSGASRSESCCDEADALWVCVICNSLFYRLTVMMT